VRSYTERSCRRRAAPSFRPGYSNGSHIFMNELREADELKPDWRRNNSRSGWKIKTAGGQIGMFCSPPDNGRRLRLELLLAVP